MIEQENERIMSRIISAHEDHILEHENSQREQKKVVVVVEEDYHRIGDPSSGKVDKLVEETDTYVGYKDGDLPILCKVHELVSKIKEEEV